MSQTYDPFERGPHPVGVRTLTFTDAARDRTLPVEVWYPAADTHAGQDRDPEHWDTFDLLADTVRQEAVRDAAPAPLAGAPLIVFSHGLAGHRRQSTFFTTHLASHGYVVIAPDHAGNTLLEVMHLAMTSPDALPEAIERSAQDRLRDVPYLIEAFPACGDAVAAMVNPESIGITGHSFGGWTTICATSGELPVQCALPLAPVGTGGGARLRQGDPYADVDLAYGNRVPTLILAANRDSLCNLKNIEQLHDAIGPAHRMFVLHDADHFHFCDRVLETHAWFAALGESGGVTGMGANALAPAAELVGEAPAHDFVRGPGLAHFDAHLRNRSAAAIFLREAAADALHERGAGVAARAPANARK